MVAGCCGLRAYAQPKASVALTLSGGVSLGSYQAGYLYYLTEFLKQNPDTLELKVLTGASAGGLNSFISILSECSRPVQDPQESLFWQVWIPLSIVDLASESQPRAEPTSLFSRRAFRTGLAEIERLWAKGLPQSCDRLLGITVARLNPSEEPYFTGLTRQVEKFTLRVRGRGLERPPQLENVRLPSQGVGQPLLALTGDATDDFARLKDLLYAATALPLAFPSQPIPHCMTNPELPRWSGADAAHCASEEIRHDEFIDGGILDNKPLALAHRLTQKLGAASATLFLYFDLNLQGYPTEAYPAATKENPRLLSQLGQTIGNTLGAARRQELFRLMEEAPELKRQILPTSNDYPRAGEAFFGFFGFFDRQLREFDFYLGMYEARVFIERQLMTRVRVDELPLDPHLRFPEINQQGDGWAPFYCLQSHLQKLPTLRAACAHPASFGIEVLLQTSMDRLRAHCERAGPKASKFISCRLTDSAQISTEILPKAQLSERSFVAGESDLRHNLRLLTNNGFKFKDLGLDQAGSAEQILVRLKTHSSRLLDRVVKRQPAGDRLLLGLVQQPLIDLYEYVPTEHFGYFVLGNSLEVGGSVIDPDIKSLPVWLRLTYGLQVKGVETLLSSGPTELAVSPLLGPEVEWLSQRSRFMQPRLALRFGHQWSLSSDDHANDNADIHSSDWLVQLTGSLTLFERLRTQVSFERQADSWNVLLGLGLQF